MRSLLDFVAHHWLILLFICVALCIVLSLVSVWAVKKRAASTSSPVTQSTLKLSTILAGKQQGPIRILAIGDSTVQGYGPQSSDYKTTAWPTQFASLATRQYNNGLFSINNVVGALFGNLDNNDNRVHYTGWTADNNGAPGYFGLGGACYVTTSNAIFGFDPSTEVDTVEIYSPVSSVSLNLIVDGTVYPLSNTTSDPTKSNAVMHVYIVHLPAPTTKELQIQSTDASQKASLAGIIAYSSNDLASVINCGVGGSSTNDWSDHNLSPTNLSRVLACYKPDLIIQNLCINNYWHAVNLSALGSGTSLDLYRSQLEILDDLYTSLNIPVLYYTPNVCGESIAPVQTQQLYIDTLKQMCVARDRSLVDIFTASISTENMLSQGWQSTSDACHPTPAGYAWIAQQLLSAIS